MKADFNLTLYIIGKCLEDRNDAAFKVLLLDRKIRRLEKLMETENKEDVCRTIS